MKYITTFLLVAAFAFSGCAESPPVTAEKKDALRKILAPEFVLTSIPKEREEDFYRVLEVFARDAKFERVTKIEFTSGSEATIQFLWSIHSGGATAKRRWGKWTVTDRFYTM